MIAEAVKQWVQKAENDLKIAQDELVTIEPATDMVCFHFQQCVEKYLKAFLVLHNKDFRWTHNIAELIELCKEIDPDFDALYGKDADKLTIYAVQVRYPDDFYMPEVAEAQTCLQIAKEVKDFVKAKLRDRGIQGL